MSRDRTVIRLGLKCGSFRSSGLSHIEAGDGAADDHALDLGGALEDREVVRRGWNRATNMLASIGLAWQDAGDCRWSSSVIFSALTEQRRNSDAGTRLIATAAHGRRRSFIRKA